MSSTNGAHYHTVEDLLSSIRTSIADDTGLMRQGPSSRLAQTPRREHNVADDHAEFELPAIFKPGHQQGASDKPHNLFGRLSDALKHPPAAEPDRSRTVIRFEPANGRMIEPPRPQPVVREASQHTGQPQPSEVSPETRVLNEGGDVKRVMPSFFDTRLNRLGEMSRKSYVPDPVEVVKPAPPEPAAAIPPPSFQPPPLRQHFAPVDNPASGVPGGAMEDAAAQLLRPILKQWLMENMPKIVEKALRSEAGGDFPSGSRKPGE